MKETSKRQQKPISLKREADEIDRMVVIDMVNELTDMITKHEEMVKRWKRERLVLENALDGGVWGR